MKKFSDEEIRILQKKSRERTVRTQNIEYDIETLAKRINNGIIKLDPDYQRNHRWKHDKSSRLIESLILNIPIPVIYISYDIDLDESTENERFSVIDGQQRLRAIIDYFNNEYELEGLDTLSEINGLSYSSLPDFLQRRLNDRTVRVLQIDSTVDGQVKYDIFERLNIGSVKLEPQEIRNATIRGKANKIIKSLASDENFMNLLQINEKNREENSRVEKMEDRELVLRFFTLYLGIEDESYKHLSRALTEKMKYLNTLSDSDIDLLDSLFRRVMRIARETFGDTAFANLKYSNGKFQYASRFNIAVYDALTQAIAKLIDTNGANFTEEKNKRYKNLFKNEEFRNSISDGTNSKKRIEYRIDAVRQAIS